MSRRMTVKLVSKNGCAGWQVTYPSGAHRYWHAAYALGDVILGLLQRTGDEVVVLPAGYSLTYNANTKEASE